MIDRYAYLEGMNLQADIQTFEEIKNIMSKYIDEKNDSFLKLRITRDLENYLDDLYYQGIADEKIVPVIDELINEMNPNKIEIYFKKEDYND